MGIGDNARALKETADNSPHFRRGRGPGRLHRHKFGYSTVIGTFIYSVFLNAFAVFPILHRNSELITI